MDGYRFNKLTDIHRMDVQMALIRRAARLCQETFPHLKTSAAIDHRLRETGIFKSLAVAVPVVNFVSGSGIVFLSLPSIHWCR
jgi:hypothetical protein